MTITVLANGAFPTMPAVFNLLGKADRVVCCDGALEKYLRWSHTDPAVSARRVSVVGDGDSLSPALRSEAASALSPIDIHTFSGQEDNDLTKAVDFAIAEAGGQGGCDLHIDILGATGLREDHTLANISLLAYYQTRYPSVTFRMISDFGILRPVQGCCRFDSFPGQQVSVFSLSPGVPVSLRGLRYPLEGRPLRWLWEGSLNESLGSQFEVEGGLLVVFVQHHI